MNGPKRKPNNMNELCRLCLAEDEVTSPIFGEEDSSSESQIPLPFRIMACVSVEVSLSDGLPKVICDKCLNHVNSWHEFKQICDQSQVTLKDWQNNAKEGSSATEKDIVIKQEPMDPEPEEDVLEIIDDDVSSQFMVEDIKQEVDMYDEDQDNLSVEAVDTEYDTFDLPDISMSNSETKDVENEDVEVVSQAAGDVSHLRITDIKTECDIIPIGNMSEEANEGRLLRSVLQGKKLNMYSKKITSSLHEKLVFQSVKPFNCRLCDKSFAYNYLLKRHEKTHKGDRNVCAYCQKGFSSHASLVQHVRFFSGSISMPYTCDYCQQEFACRTQYLSHIDGSDGSGCDVVLTNKDNPEDIGDFQEENSQCEECSETFSSQMLLRLHMRKEHLHYSCHKCDKSYTNGVALSNHLRSHSLGAIRHQCESCPRTFPSFELLKKHERTHMKENSAMTIIPSEIVSKSAEYSDADENIPLPEIDMYLDRPIKEEPPDSPEINQEEEQLETTESSHLRQSHVCHLCNEHFPSIASLRFHLKGVHLHYECHRCPKVYASGVALSNHLRSHSLSSYKKHKCLVCMKAFSTIDLLTKHKRIHSAPASISTTRKNKKFILSEELASDLNIEAFIEDENEIGIDEPLVKRTCKVCGLVAASPSALERHMACHTKEKMYTCSVCHVSMSYASSLQKHYRLIHNKNVELRAIQKNYVVGNPDLEITPIPTVQKKKEHIPGSSETSTRSGRKVIFNRTFRMTAQLQQAKLPTPYECKVCHRSFAYRSFLLKHSKVHANAQSGVTCPICLKKFADAKTLNNHKGVHTRFKHFTCHVCGKSFNGLNAWQKHERMHQKGLIYSCKLCGKRFLSKAELHEHKKMHIKVKIYTCVVCKNSYHSSSALGKHKRRHGHWYASQENLEVSEVEVVNGYNLPSTKTSVLKTVLSKANAVKQPSLKTPLVRPGVSKASISRTSTHFPSGKRRPHCYTCNKTFSHLSALKKHKRLHERLEVKPDIPIQDPVEVAVATIEDNTCITCNRTFPDHVSLVRHKGWHTRRGLSPSEPVIITTPGKMPINPCHVKTEPSPVNAFQCSICSKTFTTSTALESHVKSHSEVVVKGTSVQRSKVSADLDKSDMLTSPRRLACKICKKPFESKKALITHIGWHSRDSHLNNSSFSSPKVKSTPKLSAVDQHSCNVCHKTFSSAVILNKHKKLHTRKLMSSIKEKAGAISESVNSDANFSCSVCHRSFKLHKYLQLHMRLHTGEKKFKCNICPQAYHRSGSLWKHRRTHHGVKVFSCPVCQKRFGLKVQLTKHMETHETSVNFTNGDTVFACSMCDKTFSSLAKFKQHQKVHQGRNG